MAEAFARTYGSDVIEPASAGIAPSIIIPVETRRVMEEKDIDLTGYFPKPLSSFPPDSLDLVVNMSGFPLHGYREVREWRVRDPFGSGPDVHRQVRDQIENLTMNLILELRRGRK